MPRKDEISAPHPHPHTIVINKLGPTATGKVPDLTSTSRSSRMERKSKSNNNDTARAGNSYNSKRIINAGTNTSKDQKQVPVAMACAVSVGAAPVVKCHRTATFHHDTQASR